MKPKTITTALAAVALGLTACGSPNASDQAAHVERLQDLDAAKQAQIDNERFNQKVQHAEAAEQDIADAAPTDPQAWESERVQQYRENFTKTYSVVCEESLENYAGCGPEDPHSYIADITAPEVGKLDVTLEDGEWSNGFASEWPAEYVATGIMHFTSFDATDVEQVTVELPDGTSYTEDRSPAEYDGVYGQEVVPATS